jgi:hypothetical protein
MRFLAAVATLSLVLGCGIMSVIFGLPDRYVHREVQAGEMVGTWQITAKSEDDVNQFVKEFPDWHIMVPLTALTLNADGNCSMNLEPGWSGGGNSDPATTSTLSCAWQLAKENVLSDTDTDDKTTTVLRLGSIDTQNGYYPEYSLYIYEENGRLILWNFIGDPDDFVPQDFAKVKP